MAVLSLAHPTGGFTIPWSCTSTSICFDRQQGTQHLHISVIHLLQLGSCDLFEPCHENRHLDLIIVAIPNKRLLGRAQLGSHVKVGIHTSSLLLV